MVYKFISADESLQDNPCGRLASIVESDVLKTLIEENTCQTSRNLAKRLNVSHSTALRDKHAIEKVWKIDKWFPMN